MGQHNEPNKLVFYDPVAGEEVFGLRIFHTQWAGLSHTITSLTRQRTVR